MYHLDFETASDVDIKKVGGWRYAEDPSTEVLMFAIARDDEEPLLWDKVYGGDSALAVFEEMLRGDGFIYAHNAAFELAILLNHYCGKEAFDTLHKRMRCTAAMGRKANLPPDLNKLGQALGIKEAKDSAGKKLINFFSVKREHPREHPDKWHQFCDYCIQDVKAEREVHRKLAQFELKGTDLEVFHYDIRLNYKGVPVDVPVLHQAQSMVDRVMQDVGSKFTEITGLAPSQTVKLTEWFRLDNLQQQTVEEATFDDPTKQEAMDLLRLVKHSSVKKIDSMIACASADGRVRGSLLWYGAQNTGRWAGRLIQPQNFKRPEFHDWMQKRAYSLLRSGADEETLDALFAPPIECLANIIRLFIRDNGGATFLDADYSAIEARVLAWLAGQEDRLRLFEQGGDIYTYSAKQADPNATRQFGKVLELAFGYQGGDGAWQTACSSFGLTYDKDKGDAAKKAWREANSKIAQFWWGCQNAAIRAIRVPGKWQEVNSKVAFGCTKYAGIPYLVARLPSGRRLVYAKPRITQGRYGDEIQYWGRDLNKAFFAPVKLYGGKISENLTQGVAYDLMAHGALNAEEEGFDVFTLVHDQALAYKKEGQTPEQFAAALSVLPEWADGLPLTAEASEQESYTKT